jgi:1-aminocyclopropane-1-carboxylate synthase
MAAEWCIKHQVHLVFNEIYALSLIDVERKEVSMDYRGVLDRGVYDESFGSIMNAFNSNYLHMWYALSKDFGMSGYRVGVLYSQNEDLIKAYDNFNAPHLVSNHTQWLISLLLQDHTFVRSYIEENQKRLTDAYIQLTDCFRKLKIPFAPSRGSLFIWIDMSEFLSENSQKGENALWEEIYDKSGILLTPGEGFGHSKRGLFRVVYPCVPFEHLDEVTRRLTKFIRSKRTSH